MSVRTDVSESTRIMGGRRSAESSRVASLSMPEARRAACAGLFGFFAPLTAVTSKPRGRTRRAATTAVVAPHRNYEIALLIRRPLAYYYAQEPGNASAHLGRLR